MNRAVFLDRDGVINLRAPEGDYITQWEQMQFLPGVSEAIRLLNQNGFQVVVVTNQRCIAKGQVTAEGVQALHERMRQELCADGARVDAIYYCPHDHNPPCECRKPAPGMLLQAAREHDISLPLSWMIGDSESDIQAGENAGCRTALITSVKQPMSKVKSDVTATSLLSAVGAILDRESEPVLRGTASRGLQ